MKSKLLSLVALITVVSLLAGCDTGGNPTATSIPAPTNTTAAVQANNTAQSKPATVQDVNNSTTADLNHDGFVTLDEVAAMASAGLSEQEMVKRLLKLPGAPSADAADALACAIAHAHGAVGLGGLRKAGYRVRGGRLI